ncbi:MAG: coiled-coil domain-containing protein [Flavobacteriales bacterium]
MKINILMILLLLAFKANAQTKKEQIEILNFRIDSLNQLFSRRELTYSTDIKSKNQTIDSLSRIIVSNQQELSRIHESQKKILAESSMIKKSLDNREKQIDDLLKKLEELKHTLEQERTKYDRLEAEINKLKAVENERSNDILIIDVVNKFEDFNVVIYWLPRISDIPYGFDYVGPALICFKNSNGDTYFVHNLFFTLPSDGLPLLKDEVSNRAIIQGNNIIKRSFPQKVLANFPEVDTNFLFLLDINFDGKPELFTTGHRQGQRGVDIYIPIFGGNEILTYHEGPYISSNIYNNLDGLSEINARDKTIKIRSSNGAESSFAELYKLKIDRYGNSRFEFYKRVEY